MIFKRKLPIPQEVKEEFPLSDHLAAIKAKNDAEIKKIFTGESDKFLLVIGPCSADREDAVLDYITRLTLASREDGAVEVGISPRGDWKMPSDASGRIWIAEIEKL